MEKGWMDEKSKKLLGEILNDLFPEKRRYSLFYVSFIEAAISYIEKVDTIGFGPPSEAHVEFFRNVLPRINRFARTYSEEIALIYVLLEEIIRIISKQAYDVMEKRGLMSSDIGMRGMVD